MKIRHDWTCHALQWWLHGVNRPFIHIPWCSLLGDNIQDLSCGYKDKIIDNWALIKMQYRICANDLLHNFEFQIPVILPNAFPTCSNGRDIMFKRFSNLFQWQRYPMASWVFLYLVVKHPRYPFPRGLAGGAQMGHMSGGRGAFFTFLVPGTTACSYMPLPFPFHFLYIFCQIIWKTFICSYKMRLFTDLFTISSIHTKITFLSQISILLTLLPPFLCTYLAQWEESKNSYCTFCVCTSDNCKRANSLTLL